MANNIYKEGTSLLERVGEDVVFTQSVINGVKDGFSIEVDTVMQNYKIKPYVNGVVAGGTLYWDNDQIIFTNPYGFSVVIDTKSPNYLCLFGLHSNGKFTNKGFYIARDGSVNYIRTNAFGQFGSVNFEALPNFFDMGKIKFDIVAHRYKWKGEVTSYRPIEDSYTMSYYARILNQANQYEGIQITKAFSHQISYVSTKAKLDSEVTFNIEPDYSGYTFKVKKYGKTIFSVNVNDLHCDVRGANGETLLVRADETLKVIIATKNGKKVIPTNSKFPVSDELYESLTKKDEEEDEEIVEEEPSKVKSPQEIFNEEYKSLEQWLKDLYKNFKYEAKIQNYHQSKKGEKPKIESVTVFKCTDIEGSTLIIPHPTTTIKKETFSNLVKKSQVLTLTLCENLKTIEEGAFSNFKNLKKIEFNSPKVDRIRKNTFSNTNLSTIYFPSGVKIIEEGACNGSENLLEIYVPSGCKVMKGAVPEHCAIYYYGNISKEEAEKNKKAKSLSKRHASRNKKSAVKPKKDKSAKKNCNLGKNILALLWYVGQFFKKIGVFLLNVILFIPRKGWALLLIIGDFFRYTVADKLGGFFSGLLKVLLLIPYCIAWPFIKLFSAIKSGFRGGALISLLTIVIGAFVLVAGHYGWLKIASNAVDKFFEALKPDSLFGMHLVSGIAELIDGLPDDYGLLALPLGILCIPSLVLDVVWNIIVLILLALNGIIYFIVGLSLFYGAGVWICLPALVSAIICFKGNGGKVIPIFSLLIGIACTVLYYISFNGFYY